jgi:hypothetical protein
VLEYLPSKGEVLSSNPSTLYMVGGMAQAVKHLLSKYKALSSNSHTATPPHTNTLHTHIAFITYQNNSNNILTSIQNMLVL